MEPAKAPIPINGIITPMQNVRNIRDTYSGVINTAGATYAGNDDTKKGARHGSRK
jgi:hypothetical protein